MQNSRVNFHVKIQFVVEILTKHGRGLLLFAAPSSLLSRASNVAKGNCGLCGFVTTFCTVSVPASNTQKASCLYSFWSTVLSYKPFTLRVSDLILQVVRMVGIIHQPNERLIASGFVFSSVRVHVSGRCKRARRRPATDARWNISLWNIKKKSWKFWNISRPRLWNISWNF